MRPGAPLHQDEPPAQPFFEGVVDVTLPAHTEKIDLDAYGILTRAVGYREDRFIAEVVPLAKAYFTLVRICNDLKSAPLRVPGIKSAYVFDALIATLMLAKLRLVSCVAPYICKISVPGDRVGKYQAVCRQTVYDVGLFGQEGVNSMYAGYVDSVRKFVKILYLPSRPAGSLDALSNEKKQLDVPVCTWWVVAYMILEYYRNELRDELHARVEGGQFSQSVHRLTLGCVKATRDVAYIKRHVHRVLCEQTNEIQRCVYSQAQENFNAYGVDHARIERVIVDENIDRLACVFVPTPEPGLKRYQF
jgi:hypothetical protein